MDDESSGEDEDKEDEENTLAIAVLGKDDTTGLILKSYADTLKQLSFISTSEHTSPLEDHTSHCMPFYLVPFFYLFY